MRKKTFKFQAFSMLCGGHLIQSKKKVRWRGIKDRSPIIMTRELKIMDFRSKKTLWTTLVSALLLALLLPGAAPAAEFSADMVITSTTAGGEMTGKVFVKGHALRQEIDTPIGKQATIIPPGKSAMYVLIPGQKMYMEMPNSHVTLDGSEKLEAKMTGQGKVTKKGTETIEGYACDVYSIVYNDKKLGEGTVWVSRELNYPLKIYSKSSHDTATILYRNIRKGTLDDGLFSLPAGYSKFSM